MSFFIQDAYAASTAATASPQGGMSSIIMLVIFVVAFYLLILMPQQKRAKEHKLLISGLNKGDEVVTNGGILGRINKIDDDFVMLAVAENVEIAVQKSSVAAHVPKGTVKTIS